MILASRPPHPAALLLVPLLLTGCLTGTIPTSEPSPPPPAGATGDTGSIESRVLGEVNAFRRTKGLNSLSAHSELTALARPHSMQMASSNRLSHAGFDDRFHQLTTSGFASASENVASSRGHADVAGTAVENWRESPGHHRNMTSALDRYAGVGLAFANDGSAYITMLYAH